MPHEIGSPYMLGFLFVQPCPNQEEGIIPLVDDTPTKDETIEDDIKNLENSHQDLGVNVLPSCVKLEEYIEYDYKEVSLPTSLSKENFIIDIPPQEIIDATVDREMMVMSSSQPMTSML